MYERSRQTDETCLCLFKVLGLRSPREGVCKAAVKRAYHKLALKYHPDRQTVSVDPTRARHAFSAINKAYKVLMKRKERKLYLNFPIMRLNGRDSFHNCHEYQQIAEWIRDPSSIELNARPVIEQVRDNDDDNNDDQDGTYEVELILDMKRTDKGTEYLVKWAGYSETENSWEPMSGLKKALEAVNMYRRSNNLHPLEIIDG